MLDTRAWRPGRRKELQLIYYFGLSRNHHSRGPISRTLSPFEDFSYNMLVIHKFDVDVGSSEFK